MKKTMVEGSMLVRIQGVRCRKGGNEILRGIDLDIGRGKVVCLLGPSGAGKSTLLRCINAIEKFDEGVIYVDGDPIGFEKKSWGLLRLRESHIARQRSDIGMVFQSFNLFPHMTVLQNIVSSPVRVKGADIKETTELAKSLLEKVGLIDKMNFYPKQLSGGQQQRIAIARALAMRPKLMLFDEPTSALDPHITEEVLDVLRTLAASGMTMVVVTHEISFAREVADEIVVMADGSIVEHGPAEDVLLRSGNPVTRKFLAKSVPIAA
jgi:polar amino acid transport system ATP-binding protein